MSVYVICIEVPVTFTLRVSVEAASRDAALDAVAAMPGDEIYATQEPEDLQDQALDGIQNTLTLHREETRVDVETDR